MEYELGWNIYENYYMLDSIYVYPLTSISSNYFNGRELTSKFRENVKLYSKGNIQIFWRDYEEEEEEEKFDLEINNLYNMIYLEARKWTSHSKLDHAFRNSFYLSLNLRPNTFQ